MHTIFKAIIQIDNGNQIKGGRLGQAFQGVFFFDGIFFFILLIAFDLYI